MPNTNTNNTSTGGRPGISINTNINTNANGAYDNPLMSPVDSLHNLNHTNPNHHLQNRVSQSPRIPSSSFSHRRSSSIQSSNGMGAGAGGFYGASGSLFGDSFSVASGGAGGLGGGGSGPWQGLSGVPIGLNRLETEHNRIGINSIADIVDGNIASSPAYASAIPSSSSSWLSSQQHHPNSRGGVNTSSPSSHHNNNQTGRKAFLGFGGVAGPTPASISANQAAAAMAGFKPPTTKDIPPVTLTPIQKVSKAELRAYMQEIEDEYNMFYETRGPNGKISGVSEVSATGSSTSSSSASGSSSRTGTNAGGGSVLGVGGASVAGVAGRVPNNSLGSAAVSGSATNTNNSSTLSVPKSSTKAGSSTGGSRRLSGYSPSIQTSVSAVSSVFDSILGPSNPDSLRPSIDVPTARGGLASPFSDTASQSTVGAGFVRSISPEAGEADDGAVSSIGSVFDFGNSNNNSNSFFIDDNLSDNANYSPEITPLSSVPDAFFESDFQLDNPRIFDVVSENSTIVRPSSTNPATSSSSASTVRGKELVNNSILQEKLSWYIDTVELHLIREISNASHSFFSALEDLRTINVQARDCIAAVQQLRSDLALIDETRVLAGAQSVNLKLRRRNTEKLLQALDQVAILLEKSDIAEEFLMNKEMDNCLEYLDALDELFCGKGNKQLAQKSAAAIENQKNEKGSEEMANDEEEDEVLENALVTQWTKNWKYPLSDIRSVQGLSELRDSLITLRSNAGSEYAKNFTQSLVNDVRTHVNGVSKQETLFRLGKVLRKAVPNHTMGADGTGGLPRTSASSPKPSQTQQVNMSYLQIDPELRKNLETTIRGLARSNNVQGALTAYQDTIVKEAKNTVRKYLPSSNSAKDIDDTSSVSSSMTGRGSSASDRSVSLAALLRGMSEEEFQEMVANTYASLSELFRRVSIQQKLLLDVSVTFASDVDNNNKKNGKKASSSSNSQPPPIIDTSELVRKVIHSSLTRIVKIFNARREQNASMGIPTIVNFYSLSVIFLAECEAIVGLEIDTTLGDTITNHLRLFLGNFHRLNETEFSIQMDRDQWKEEEITPEFQELVDTIVTAGHKDPYEWIKMLRSVLNEEEEDNDADNKPADKPKEATEAVSNGADASLPPSKRNRKLYIGNGVFTIPIASIQAVTIIEQYLKLIVLLPHLASQTLTSAAGFLSQYNTKANQLILGAGATRTAAALKHITAKHLVLCSQGLNLLITLIPYIKECCKRHFTGFGGNSNINSPRSSTDGSNDTRPNQKQLQLQSSQQHLAPQLQPIQQPPAFDQLDKVLADLKSHQSEIYQKFIDLLGEKMSSHAIAIRKINWATASSSPVNEGTGMLTQEPNRYMQQLVKDTTVLARILTTHLPKSTYLVWFFVFSCLCFGI